VSAPASIFSLAGRVYAGDVNRQAVHAKLEAAVTVDHVRAEVDGLPRSYDMVVRGRLKYRVGKIVYLAFSADQSIMEFAFPKEWRDVLVNADPETYMHPSVSDMRFNWVRARMSALDVALMRARMSALDGRDARAGPGRVADGRAKAYGGELRCAARETSQPQLDASE
jgi:hypothetical protein